MPLIEDIVDWTKNRLVYMAGRGLFSMVLIGSALAFPSILAWESTLLLTAIVGTTALQAFMTYRQERQFENRLVTTYRDEVAAKLGIDPKQVTLENLKDVANGHPDLGLDGNPVLKQSIEVGSKRHLMQFATTALAGLTVLGVALLSWATLGFSAGATAGEGLSQLYNMFPVVSQYIDPRFPVIAGSLFVAGTGMGILNQVFDRVGERVLGIAEKTTNQYIMDIKRDITRGRMISQEQVFGVYVSANKALAAQIEQEFGRPYHSMNQRQQHLALEEFAPGLNIRQVTADINHRLIDPEELAFKVVGQESGVPKKGESRLREEALKETTARDLVEEVKRAVTGKDPEQTPANDNVEGFAKRFAPRESGEAKTHVEKYAAKRAEHPVSYVEQEAERTLTQQQNQTTER